MATESPRVSVIIPAYNAAAYVAEAISSVQVQTYTDLEIIVVDDGSTDETAAVVAGIADDRLRYVYQENASQAVARNTGIRGGQSEVIAFLDADDRWLPKKLEEQLGCLQDPQVGVVCSGAKEIDEDGGLLTQRSVTIPGGDTRRNLICENFVYCSSAVVRRELLDAHDLEFRCGRQGTEDWDLWLRLAKHTTFASVQRPLIEYRVHPASTSRRFSLIHASEQQTLGDLAETIDDDAEMDSAAKLRLLQVIRRASTERTLRYGHKLLATGHRGEARSIMRKALSSSPASPRAWWGLCKTYLPG